MSHKFKVGDVLIRKTEDDRRSLYLKIQITRIDSKYALYFYDVLADDDMTVTDSKNYKDVDTAMSRIDKCYNIVIDTAKIWREVVLED